MPACKVKTIDGSPVPQHEVLVQLVMTEPQATALKAVLMGVGGSPDTTRRGLIEPICDALHEYYERHDDTQGVIMFQELEDSSDGRW